MTKKKNNQKQWVWAALLTLILIAVISSVLEETFRSVPVNIAVVTQGEIQSYTEERARTSLPHTYNITMPLQGRILPITLAEGERVMKGDVVAHIEDLDWQDYTLEADEIVTAVNNWVIATEAEVKANKVRQDYDQWIWENDKKLHDTSTISDRKMRDSKRLYLDSTVKIEGSQAMLRMSMAIKSITNLLPGYVKRNLDRTQVKSPVTGVILKRYVWNEKSMSPGEPLLDIGNLNAMEVTADILSEEAVSIQPEDRVEIFGESIGNDLIEGKVRLVEPEAFTQLSSLGVEEQRVAVKISLSKESLKHLKQSGKNLGLNYRVRVRIITETKKNVSVIPRTSLFLGTNDRWQVYQIVDGQAKLTTVKVGLMNNHQAEIISGLRHGDSVIVAPESSINDGLNVSAIP